MIHVLEAPIPQAESARQDEWPMLQAALRGVVGYDAHDAWFGRLQFERLEEGMLTVSVPIAFVRNWIGKHYADQLFDAAVQIWPEVTKVEVVLRSVALRSIIAVVDKPPELPEQPAEKDETGQAEDEPDSGTNRKRPLKIEAIQDIVAAEFNLSRSRLLSGARTFDIAHPRQAAMYVVKIFFPKKSWGQIAAAFGGKDHTTALSGVRRVAWLIGDTSFGRPTIPPKAAFGSDTVLRDKIQSLIARLQE